MVEGANDVHEAAGGVSRQVTKPPPLVAAIVPTHNRAHCLPHALDSIHAQERRGECFELEILVVDDGSEDATADVVQRYPGVRYIRLPERRGVAAALNEGVRASHGRYLAVLGDDDLWLPHKLRTQVALLEAHPEVGVVYGQSVVRREGGEFLFPDAAVAPSGWVFMAMLMSNFCGHHASCLIRRAAFDGAGHFDESLGSYEDYDVSLRLAFRAPFLFAPGAVDVYNVSPRGLWLTRLENGAAVHDAVRVVEKALRLLPDSPDYAAVKRQARTRIARSVAQNMLEATSGLGDLGDVWMRVVATLRASSSTVRHEGLRGHLDAACLLRGEIIRAVVRFVIGRRAYVSCARAYRRGTRLIRRPS